MKKCYFETYRFSEDLDFTVTEEAHIDEAYLLQAFRHAVGCFRERPVQTVRLSIDRDEPVGRINPEVVDKTTDEEIAGQRARDDLADQRYFLLSTEKYEEFLKLLDRPAQQNPGLERLLSSKAPWERQGQ